ncbi:hypothetical protein BDV36DRAFT_298868 [Aspergillus pseudocaelatus]|uniref:Uncharacterized protein n=1 Tax=Aspergillus pseudocaelatus TaxID=1825620 RepID=A0ABQ6WEQ1_9EURO|nr:hypothetical protein BDV36DRAFT_298868 [Aspergillus pseudocaelatus]
MGKGEKIYDFHAGDNQRIIYHNDQTEVREKLPAMGPAEDPSSKPLIRDTSTPRVKGHLKENPAHQLRKLPSDASSLQELSRWQDEVERPDGVVDTINSHQIFWNGQDPGSKQMSLGELYSVLYHLHRDDSHHGVRIPLDAYSLFPGGTVAHTTHYIERDGRTPVYFGSAIDFKGGVHPCEVATYWNHTSEGKVPEGRQPILGDHESDGRPQYHAVAEADRHMVPGKVAPHMGGVNISYNHQEHIREYCKILYVKTHQ